MLQSTSSSRSINVNQPVRGNSIFVRGPPRDPRPRQPQIAPTIQAHYLTDSDFSDPESDYYNSYLCLCRCNDSINCLCSPKLDCYCKPPDPSKRAKPKAPPRQSTCSCNCLSSHRPCSCPKNKYCSCVPIDPY